MKNIIIGFIAGLFITACATSVVLPSLSERELTIHESGKLAYNYCGEWSFFGKCKAFKTEFYDISKSEVRVKLSDFRCKSRLRSF